MTTAPDDFDETLLSAYLDNELTSSERKAVEEQLTTSSDLRKLLEELQSIRSMVQQLHGQAPRRSFADGPWNLPSDQGNQPVVLAQPDQALPTVSSSNSHQAWSWQRLASLAAMLVIALGVGGLWWANRHRGSTNPLGYTPKNERAWKEKGSVDGPPQDSLLSEELGIRTEQPANQPMEPPLDAPASIRNGESSERGLIPAPPAPILSKSLSPGRGATPSNDSKPTEPAPMNLPAPAPSAIDASIMDGPATYSLRTRQPKPNSDSRGEPENAPVAMNDIPMESRERSDRLALVLLPIETQSNYRRLQFNEPSNRFAGGNAQDKAARDANQTLSEQEQETPNAIVYRFIRPAAKEPNLSLLDAKDDQSGGGAANLALTPADQAKVPAGPGGSGGTREEEQLQRQRLEFRKLASDFDSDKSVVVEFLVAREDWELGSSELRQLGVQVPMEIPESQVLDLQGRLASTPTNPVDQRDTDATNGREDSSKNEATFRWSLVVPDVSRDANQKDNLPEDKPGGEALEAKKSKQEMVRSASRGDGLIRIRVRIMMSEP